MAAGTKATAFFQGKAVIKPKKMATASFSGQQVERNGTIQFEVKGYDHSDFLNIVREITKQHGTEKIKCIQPLGGGKFQVTFKTQEIAIKAATVGLKYGSERYPFTELAAVSTAIYVKRAPYELKHETIVQILNNYGIVKEIKHVPIDEQFPEISNGDRRVIMVIKNEIPNWIKIGPYTLMIYYRGIKKTCRTCNSEDHYAANCPSVLCHRCKSVGHMANRCTNEPAGAPRRWWDLEDQTEEEIALETQASGERLEREKEYPLLDTRLAKITNMIKQTRNEIPNKVISPIKGGKTVKNTNDKCEETGDPFKPRKSLSRSPIRSEKEDKQLEEGEIFDKMLEENKEARKNKDPRIREASVERENKKAKRGSPETNKPGRSASVDSRQSTQKKRRDESIGRVKQ